MSFSHSVLRRFEACRRCSSRPAESRSLLLLEREEGLKDGIFRKKRERSLLEGVLPPKEGIEEVELGTGNNVVR